jgi:hypothetical protein
MNKMKSKEFLYPIDRDWLMGGPEILLTKITRLIFLASEIDYNYD